LQGGSRSTGALPIESRTWERYAPWYILEETQVYAPDTRELDFYRALRGRHRGRCLEIGSGHGRLARSLGGPSLTAALEPSPAMLSGWTASDRSLASRIRGRGQEIPFRDSSFGLVVFPYNGIQCIVERRERLRVLEEARRVTARTGLFVLEVCHAFSFRPEEAGAERYNTRLDSGLVIRLVESISRCVEERTISYDMTYSDSDGRSENIVLRLGLIDREDLEEDLGLAGFGSIRFMGDYDGSPFEGEDSPRLLALAGKGVTT
jgi:SAM-dependent methyltransferase